MNKNPPNFYSRSGQAFTHYPDLNQAQVNANFDVLMHKQYLDKIHYEYMIKYEALKHARFASFDQRKRIEEFLIDKFDQ